MKLSDFQKTVIKSLLSGKCTTIDSFLTEFGELTQEKASGNSYIANTSFERDSPVYVPKNRELTETRLKEYVSLLDRLQKIGLIYTVSFDLQAKGLFPLFTAAFGPDVALLSLVIDRLKKEIVPLPELSEFVLRGYLTTEEYIAKEENRDRKKAQRLTLIIAIISITATFLSSLFQYLTYTTERNVIIKNQSAFPDTTKVLILNSKPLIKDSLHVSTKHKNK